MRVVLQRVERAAVRVGADVVGQIGPGLVALVGVGQASTAADAAWLAEKTAGLRVFPVREDGPMQRSVAEIGGAVLAISQFTLYGDTRKGRRPSFIAAAPPAQAERLYAVYCDALSVPVARGVFGAYMRIEMVADGPVTLTLRREDGGTG